MNEQIRDLADSKMVEAALRKSEKAQRKLARELKAERSRLLAAQRVAKVGSWETDLTTMSVNWSDETHRIHETDPATFQHTHSAFLAIVHPDDRMRVDEAFRTSMDRHEPTVIEHRLSMPDGRIKFVEERWQVLFDKEDKPVSAIGTCQDITERKQAEAQLKLSEQRLLLATESAHIGIWDWDVVTNKLVWDKRMYALYGIHERDFSGAYEAWQSCLHPDDKERVEADSLAALQGNRGYHTEFRAVWPGGQVRYLESHALVQRDDNGTAIRMIGVNWDVTERNMAIRRVKYLNRVYAMLSSINALIVRIHDRDELFRQTCRIAVDKGGFGMTLIGLVGRDAMTINPVASADDDERLLKAVKHLVSANEKEIQTLIALAVSGKKVVISDNSQDDPRMLSAEKYAEAGIRSMAMLPLIIADETVGVIAFYSREAEFFHEGEIRLLTELAGDIAYAIDHINKQERLNYLAYYDPITGLANRTLFIDRLVQYNRSALNGGYKLALFLVNLERFKNINDTFGRLAGDELLRQAAEWLRLNAGDANLVARIESDHFAVILPQIRQDGDLTRLIENRIGVFLEHPFRLNDAILRISARVGVTIFPDDGSDAEMLLRNGEAALKRTRTTGDRFLFYSADMTDKSADKLSLENQLRQAIINDEFVVHYQPKINLVSGKITGAEALVRWNDPRTGLVLPDRFIPTLEETGLIVETGRWVLRQAIKDYLRLRAAGLSDMRIAVNVSPYQLRNHSFLADLTQVISISADAVNGLELEITESLLMEDVRTTITTLQAIRDMGISIAIDDFGTGFSSLNYLSKLPVDTLKVDRSFVVDMTTGPEGLALISTIINLAHSLRLKVVAEGVDSEEQSRLLRLLNCDELQGFLFSEAVPVEIFEKRFLTRSPESKNQNVSTVQESQGTQG